MSFQADYLKYKCILQGKQHKSAVGLLGLPGEGVIHVIAVAVTHTAPLSFFLLSIQYGRAFATFWAMV